MAKPVVVISGGAGFLGSHLCDSYINKGYRVIALDDLSTGAQTNIAHLRHNPDFSFIEHDICRQLPKSLFQQNISIVANLASPASPPQYQRLAIETLKVGSTGVLNMLELARHKGARFLQASTSEVYGDPKIHPQPENYWGNVNSYGPRSMYDESKRFAEAVIYVYRTRYKLDTAVVRIFNTYGPRMEPGDGRVVSNFIVQALHTQPLTIYGKGSQTRSFCYVDDLIDGFIAMIESGQEGPINLGNPTEFTVFELAKLVQKLTSSKSKIVYTALPEDDPIKRKPAIDKAKKLLKWEPHTTLEVGLKKTINYFEKLSQ
jgi:nucleoside-diphosphate-sugar epimerase